MGPAATIRGPIRVPFSISRRQLSRASRSPPMSRMPVIPFATRSGNSVCFAHTGFALMPAMWVCMSQSPGIRNFPRASIRRASFGISIDPLLATPTIESAGNDDNLIRKLGATCDVNHGYVIDCERFRLLRVRAEREKCGQASERDYRENTRSIGARFLPAKPTHGPIPGFAKRIRLRC